VNVAANPKTLVAPMTRLRREAQLLLCCARTSFDDDARR